MYKEERDVLENMRKIDESAMEKLVKLGSTRREKTNAILVHTWWPQKAKQEGDKISKEFLCYIWKET